MSVKNSNPQKVREEIIKAMSGVNELTGGHKRNRDVFFKKTWSLLGDLGFPGFLMPEEYGGRDLSASEYAMAMETIAEFDPMAAYTINEHCSIGSLCIVKFGSEAQKKKYLPSLASGKIIGAFGLTEPDHGSDVTLISTKAEKDGDGYVLNGKKIHLSLAANADLYTITTSVTVNEKAQGTMFILERNNKGLKNGLEDTSPAGYIIPGAGSIILEDCKVPSSALLGEIGGAAKIFRGVGEVGRIGISAAYVGSSQTAYERSVKWAKKRIQFGKPLASFQSIQFKLADMKTKVQAARLLVRNAAQMIDDGEEDEAIVEASAMAKSFTMDMAHEVGSEAVQIHGGYAYLEDPPVDWYMRDGKMGGIIGGTTEVMKILISRRILK